MIQSTPQTSAAYELLHQGTLALARAERQGIRVDVDYLDSKQKELTQDIIKLEKEFKSSKLYHHWEKSFKGKVNIHMPMVAAIQAIGILDLKMVMAIPFGPMVKSIPAIL